MNKEIADATKDGYVKTIMNRKRIIEELNSSNYDDEQFKEDFERNFTVKD